VTLSRLRRRTEPPAEPSLTPAALRFIEPDPYPTISLTGSRMRPVSRRNSLFGRPPNQNSCPEPINQPGGGLRHDGA
jgi:hypothetical protein